MNNEQTKKRENFEKEILLENIQTVIWDCDNVMWFHKKRENLIISEMLKIKETEEFSEQFYKIINVFNTYFAKKKVTIDEMYKIVEKEMPILFFYNISPKQFMDVWADCKFKINEFNEDSLKVIEYLSNKGFKNIIKTDWWTTVQIDMLKEFGILDYVEKIYGCENSYLKSNPLSAKELIVPGREDEILIIGDSLSSDICFANHAGIKSIWFNRELKENETEYKPTYEITSLLEVMNIL